MRVILSAFVCLGVVAAPASAATPIDDPKSPEKILKKAIEAMGGEEKLARLESTRTKAKGTMELMGLSVDLNIDMTAHKDMMRMTLEIDVMGNKVTMVHGYNGKKGWIQVLGQDIELDDDQQSELKESAHLSRVTSLLPLVKEAKDFELEALGESKIDKMVVVGLKVKSKGHKDVTLFFAKENALLVRYERQGLDPEKNKVKQTTVLEDYKDFDGVKQPQKVKLLNDGNKFMEFEVLEIEFLKKVDTKQFEKP